MSENNNPFPFMEQEVLKFWDKAKTFEKSVKRDAPKGDYVFYDGPPFATGTPHYGHIVASLMKDAVPRYWTMNGYRVDRVWGWDCHGLPIENIIEKELKTKSKKDIEDYGIDKFNKDCCSKVLSYAEEWKTTIKKLGRWVDMENAYKTMDLPYMESVWWVFKQLWDKELIYEGYRSMHICPRCETTLSQSEVAEGYRNIKDLSAIVKFKIEKDTYVLAWTTTPWTLIGNSALAVNQDIKYIKVKLDNEYLILANMAEKALEGKNYEIVEEFKGKDLINKSYEPLFDYYANAENHENGWKIYAADFVNTEEGTGVVHIAPAFGNDDMELGKEKNLPFIQHLGMDGNMKAEVKDFAGLNVKPKDDHLSTDVKIIKYLNDKGLLFSKSKYEHSYPHCWRCETPLLNYAMSSLFVNISKLKEKLLKTAKDINWSPAHIKEGRFGNWLEDAHDWSISRQRFWASVIPIWKCECGEFKVFGSVSELEEASKQKITDLHKHVVDKISFSCKCGNTMKRVPDVLDCWFESGSMPYAQMHYPFDNKDKFEKNFPAEFIAEGVDQTRAWFYYLHVIATAINNSNTFNNAVVNGIVLAEDGKKMSKKLNNYPDPNKVIDKYGADALRMYFLTSPVMHAENLNFSEKGVEDSLRKNTMLLWNVFKFYDMYADDNVKADYKSDNVLDKWIISKLNQLITEVSKQMNAYNLPKASRPITEFINDFSTWYLRRSRDRFKGDDKKSALAVTKYVFVELSKVLAPFMPFVAESLWQKASGNNFSNSKSVHLEIWPKAGKIDNDVIKNMELTRKIVEQALAKRDEAKIKIRQPLSKLNAKGKEIDKLADEFKELIADEVNIKQIELSSGDDLIIELDVNITPELELEGIKREIVRFVNMIRKEAGLTIKDMISVHYDCSEDKIKKVMKDMKDEIMKDTLSNDIVSDMSNVDEKKEVKVNGYKLNLGIIKN
ncbi:MAG: isoleucine--tRNA ligase [bacterium]